MNVKYFGTRLNEKGHFLQDLLSQSLDYSRTLDLNKFPFDIQSLTKGKPKGYVLKTVIDKYKIIAIEGSCCDQRGGTSSVFITTDNVNLKQFESYLLLHPWVNQMIDLMPFEVDLKTETISNTEEIAIEMVKKHLKVLTDQNRIEHIKKEYFELSIKHALTTIHFMPKDSINEIYWAKVSNHVLHMNPSKLFDR